MGNPVADQDLFQRARSDSPNQEGITDYEAWHWAQSLIHDVNEEIVHEDKSAVHFVRSFLNWKQLVKLLNLIQFSMYSRSVSEAELKRHKTLTTSLMAIGSVLESEAEKFGESDTEMAKQFGADRATIGTLLKNVTDSFEEWHVEVSNADQEEIRAAFGVSG